MIFGVDISHWDGAVDFGKLAAAGCDFVGIKCTEHGVLDPTWKTNVAGAQAANIPVFGYAFLHGSDTTNMMLATFSALEDAGCTIALDWEAADAPPSIVEAWINMYESKHNRQGLAYYGVYPAGGTASPKIGTWPRWFPEYSSSSRIPPCATLTTAQDWRNSYLIWQYTEEGTINGINGHVDMNHSAPVLTLPALVNWLNTGSFNVPTPVEPPTPVVITPPTPVTPTPATFAPTPVSVWQKQYGEIASGRITIEDLWRMYHYYKANPG